MPATLPDHPLEKYLHLLFPYAYNILSVVEVAKDAVQEILVKHLSNTQEQVKDKKVA